VNSKPDGVVRCPVPRELLLQLTKRPNALSVVLLGLHFGLLLVSGVAVHALWAQGHYWAMLPVLWLHGFVFTFLGYAGLGHELNHGTVFGSARVNRVLFQCVSWLTWNNPVYFKASHTCHHKHTLAQGVDFEVSAAPYPLLPHWYLYAFVDVPALLRTVRIYANNICNRVPGPFGQRHFMPGSILKQQLVRTARLHVLLHGLALMLAVYADQVAWLFTVTLATFIATLPNRILAKLQHVGLEHNSKDFRRNSRTVLLPRWLAFLYWNMNYHIEHHMYPAVPYCNLPQLRKQIEQDLPQANTSLWQALAALRMPPSRQQL
jgi:fatty acid desaturase